MFESALQLLKLVILIIFFVWLLFNLFRFAVPRISTGRRVAGALPLAATHLPIVPAHPHHNGFQAVFGLPDTAGTGALHARFLGRSGRGHGNRGLQLCEGW